MKYSAKLSFSYLVFFLVQLGLFIFSKTALMAASTKPVEATVKTSICGNFIKESGEDCDNSDLKGKNCASLGFSAGNLTCDIACSFETSQCTVPVINPANVSPGNILSLVAAGYFSIPGSASIISTPVLTTNEEIVINIPVSGRFASVVLPQDLTITTLNGTNFDPTTDLAVAVVSNDLASGLSANTDAQAILQWGVAGNTLGFDLPITITVYVGLSNEGTSLDIVRSSSLANGWANDGIVAPATCLVTNGLCTFRATKASYFAAVKEIATPVPTSTSAPSSSSSSTSSLETTTQVSILKTLLNIFKLPRAISVFDTNGDEKITKNELAIIISAWVDGWSDSLESGSTENQNCDVNGDDYCDLTDFSILLFYSDR